jgi:hypothetical protein
MFSDHWVGGGGQRLFDSANVSISLSATAGYAEVGVSGGTSGDYYTLEFAAPPGQTLAPGVYVGAQRAPFREAARPGIDIYASGRSATSLFEVLDVGVDGSGNVTRLWLIYEQHCEGGRPALFGEGRVGEPPSTDPALVAPRTVRWPASDVGRASTVVPVTLHALDAPVAVTGASLTGSNASDFRIREDDCTGQSLVGSSCQYGPASSPASPVRASPP